MVNQHKALPLSSGRQARTRRKPRLGSQSHATTQITLDLGRGGPALRRGDKGDSETTKKGQRRVEDDNCGKTKVRGELEAEGIV